MSEYKPVLLLFNYSMGDIVFGIDPICICLGVSVGLKLLVCSVTSTLWNILMVLGRTDEQDEMTCCVQV